MQNEIWKTVKGYEGFYEVSNLGMVRSLDRKIKRSDGQVRNYKGKILKSNLDINGYPSVGLTRNGKTKVYRIHLLVAIAFLNHVPCGHELVIDHIDNNRSNNSVNNIQIVSQRENCTKDKKSNLMLGVSYYNNKYYSRISVNGTNEYLGRYESELDAHEAYMKRRKEIENATV